MTPPLLPGIEMFPPMAFDWNAIGGKPNFRVGSRRHKPRMLAH